MAFFWIKKKLNGDFYVVFKGTYGLMNDIGPFSSRRAALEAAYPAMAEYRERVYAASSQRYQDTKTSYTVTEHTGIGYKTVSYDSKGSRITPPTRIDEPDRDRDDLIRLLRWPLIEFRRFPPILNRSGLIGIALLVYFLTLSSFPIGWRLWWGFFFIALSSPFLMTPFRLFFRGVLGVAGFVACIIEKIMFWRRF